MLTHASTGRHVHRLVVRVRDSPGLRPLRLPLPPRRCLGRVQVLPEAWTEHARTPTPVPETEPYGYGAHWWTWPGESGSLVGHGFEGQRVVVLPARDLVLVRLGKTVEAQRMGLDTALARSSPASRSRQ